MTTSTMLPEVRQNSSLHLMNRNTRGQGVGPNYRHTQTNDTPQHKNKNKNDSTRTTTEVFPLESTHTPRHTMRLRLGPEHSHSENNDFHSR